MNKSEFFKGSILQILLGPLLNTLCHLWEKDHNKYKNILPIVFGKSGSSVMAARNKASAKGQMKGLRN